jgi:WD40 repeat protein
MQVTVKNTNAIMPSQRLGSAFIVSPDGQHVLTNTSHDELVLLEASTGKGEHRQSGHVPMSFSPDSKEYLFRQSQPDKHERKILGIQTVDKGELDNCNLEYPCSTAFLCKGQKDVVVVSRTLGGMTFLDKFQRTPWKRTADFSLGDTFEEYCFADPMMLFVSLGGEVTLVNVHTGKQEVVGKTSEAMPMALSPDATKAAWSNRGEVHVWDRTKACEETLHMPLFDVIEKAHLAFTPDGRYLRTVVATQPGREAVNKTVSVQYWKNRHCVGQTQFPGVLDSVQFSDHGFVGVNAQDLQNFSISTQREQPLSHFEF